MKQKHRLNLESHQFKRSGRKDYKKIKARVKTPAEVFKTCPYCDSTDVFTFLDEALCNSCGWNSISVHNWAMDKSNEIEKKNAKKEQNLIELNKSA